MFYAGFLHLTFRLFLLPQALAVNLLGQLAHKLLVQTHFAGRLHLVFKHLLPALRLALHMFSAVWLLVCLGWMAQVLWRL